jgi:hypothetical protein
MKLELAIVLSAAPEGCRVQPLDGDRIIEAAYAAPVFGQIKIRPRQLVILDIGAAPPQVVWRWFRGPVVYRAAEQVVVDNRRHQPGYRDQISVVRVADVLETPLDVGDEVFYSLGEDGVVVDVAIDGRPAHPARLRADLFPALEDLYAEMNEQSQTGAMNA